VLRQTSRQAPAVSVIIPCFNLGQYLDEAVDSVLAQSVQDFEILIVDDGSTDTETKRILDGFVRPQTTVFRTPNRGLAAARNFLIEKARGQYLCALDADDKLHPQYFEKTLDAFAADPSLTFVGTLLQMFGEENGIWPAHRCCDLATLLCDDTVITPALVRRDAVSSVGGYDEAMPHQGDEDWDLWISLVERGHRGVILADVLFYYRRRPNSMCIDCTTGQKHIDLIEYIVGKHTASYRTHFWHVLAWKEAHLRQALQANVDSDTHLRGYVEPTVERRRAELDLLRRRLAHLKERRLQQEQAATVAGVAARADQQGSALSSLSAEYRRALADIEALRRSASWRVTAPLRKSYELLLRVTGRTDK
jgi:glycosyltransferase involved in cell wall biosynthesis